MRPTQNKVRIIGGRWRSRIITFPVNPDLRPTPDRVRETLFNWIGQDLSGKTCLDLFSGSGALSFESASRGALQVVMVESNPKILSALQANLQKLGTEGMELVSMDAIKFLASDRRAFDIIFLDPPYRLELLPELLCLLPSHLAEDGLVYIEGQNLPALASGWQVWRSGRASMVSYQLLKLATNG
ncbi:MAG: 16S rRNA (guanine(966)-N(2))-methyltransferase RsmD [Nitrosomonadaceae bacterium]